MKSPYVNFYFKDKKVALHRILYHNFIGLINDGEYLKFTCENRGKCCNINHFIKYNNTHAYTRSQRSISDTRSDTRSDIETISDTEIIYQAEANSEANSEANPNSKPKPKLNFSIELN